jgi:hypothetical protein
MEAFMKTRILLSLVLTVAATEARAVSSAIDFDQGVSAAAALASAGALPAYSPVLPAHDYYTRDCATFVFGPDSPLRAGPVWLHSTSWGRDCRGPWSNPWDSQRPCFSFPSFSYTESVKLTLLERKPLLPWERDTFQVCLEGPFLSAYALSAAYEYRQAPNRLRGDFAFSPGKKVPMAPDAAGITQRALTSGLELKLNNKCASIYPVEKVRLHLYLVQVILGPLTGTILDTTSPALPTATSYEINLLDFAEEFKSPLRPGATYFVKYSFRREGSVSNQDWKPNWGYLGAIGTEKIVYQP